MDRRLNQTAYTHEPDGIAVAPDHLVAHFRSHRARELFLRELSEDVPRIACWSMERGRNSKGFYIVPKQEYRRIKAILPAYARRSVTVLLGPYTDLRLCISW